VRKAALEALWMDANLRCAKVLLLLCVVTKPKGGGMLRLSRRSERIVVYL
jgi:hypothetical protein